MAGEPLEPEGRGTLAPLLQVTTPVPVTPPQPLKTQFVPLFEMLALLRAMIVAVPVERAGLRGATQ